MTETTDGGDRSMYAATSMMRDESGAGTDGPRGQRELVGLLAPSPIVGEAFARALATGGWAVDVIDAALPSEEGWWAGFTVMIVLESMLRAVPPALLRGDPGQPGIVVVADGPSPADREGIGRPTLSTIRSLLLALGESTDAGRLGNNLTSRHREILQLVAIGYTTEEVGERLGIAAKTVNNHLSTMYRRMRARNLTQAVLMAVRAGLVDFTA